MIDEIEKRPAGRPTPPRGARGKIAKRCSKLKKDRQKLLKRQCRFPGLTSTMIDEIEKGAKCLPARPPAMIDEIEKGAAGRPTPPRGARGKIVKRCLKLKKGRQTPPKRQCHFPGLTPTMIDEIEKSAKCLPAQPPAMIDEIEKGAKCLPARPPAMMMKSKNTKKCLARPADPASSPTGPPPRPGHSSSSPR
ncbi:MAG: hypothetical protein LBP95_03275 [Deltaproteobacteria bacterium]|jgi:hypothetical protein|nr:hypothetical protein [Deltaproteobacteria bacterium]